MIGQTFISYEGGWACSNDCYLDVEKDINISAKSSVTTMVLKVNGIFIGKGAITKDLSVNLIFKNEKDELIGFNGYIRSIIETKLSIVLVTKHNKVQELLTFLNKEINNGR